MILVPSIKRGVNWAGVKNQRHVRGGCRSASLTAVREELDSPTPRLCGFGRYVAALTSSASRITVARETFRETASLRSRSMTSSSATIVVRSIHHYVPMLSILGQHASPRPSPVPSVLGAAIHSVPAHVRLPGPPDPHPISRFGLYGRIRSFARRREVYRGRPRTESDSCRALDRSSSRSTSSR